MFQSNTDFEYDNLFNDGFPTNNLINTKRGLENEVALDKTSKKVCLLKDISSISLPVGIQRDIKIRNPHKVANSPNKRIVLRKFPGPAGLLPESQDFNIDLKALESNAGEAKQTENENICSQMSVSAFCEGPWHKMSNDLSRNSDLFLPDKYNIAWIKDKVKNNKLINQKAPFVAAVIQNIEPSKTKTAVVSMSLKDPTGQIHGTIVHDLYEEYINELKVGAVMVLKQFGVLKTHRGYNYITITNNNLIAIYSSETDDTKDISKVKVTIIQKLCVNDLIKNISDVKMRHRNTEKLKSVFGFNESNLKLLQKSEMHHVNRNQFVTPIKSRSSGEITANFNELNNCKNSPNLNISLSDVNSSSSKRKFNFKPLKCSNSNNSISGSNSNAERVELVTNENRDPSTIISSNKNVMKNSQISVISNDNTENTVILENIFEGVDADMLFGDF